MDLEDLRLKDFMKLTESMKVSSTDSFFEVGKSYLIRTVTFYYTGRLKKINSRELLLEEVSWIADTGRFSECLMEGKFNEIEPFLKDVIIPRDSLIDATVWTHKLPRSVK